MKFLTWSVFIFLLVSCDKFQNKEIAIPEDVKKSIILFPKTQQEEVLKVIDHYSRNPKDTLKLYAAYFQIKEIPRKHPQNSSHLKRFDILFDIINKKYPKGDTYLPRYGNQMAQIIDSLELKFGECCPLNLHEDKKMS